MFAPRMRFVFLLLLVATAACLASSGYRGDGTLQDRGWMHFNDRYKITFGKIKLIDNDERHFRAIGLPDRRFNLGIELDSVTCHMMNSDARISFVVTNESGAKVIYEEHAFRDLTWDTALGHECDHKPFGYVRGRAKEITYGKNGDTCAQPIYTGADKGQGTYFNGRANGLYTVTVQVHRATLPKVGMQSAVIVLEDDGDMDDDDNDCHAL